MNRVAATEAVALAQQLEQQLSQAFATGERLKALLVNARMHGTDLRQEDYLSFMAPTMAVMSSAKGCAKEAQELRTLLAIYWADRNEPIGREVRRAG